MRRELPGSWRGGHLDRVRVGVAFLVLLFLLGSARWAGAHGLLLQSTPKAGETALLGVSRLELRFNVRIEPALSALRLVGPSGAHVPFPSGLSGSAGPDRLAAALAPLDPGGYTVHWKVLTKDGHVSHGRFSFQVAEGR